MKLVASTCSEQFSSQSVLYEPPQSGLPAGLLASPCLIQVERGTVYVPMVNVGTTKVLYPRTGLGCLRVTQVVSLPAGVIEVGPISATMSSQTAAPVVPTWMEDLDLSASWRLTPATVVLGLSSHRKRIVV